MKKAHNMIKGPIGGHGNPKQLFLRLSPLLEDTMPSC